MIQGCCSKFGLQLNAEGLHHKHLQTVQSHMFLPWIQGHRDFHSPYCHDSLRTSVEEKYISALPNHKLQMLLVCQLLRKGPHLSGGAVRRCNSLTKSTVCRRWRLLIAYPMWSKNSKNLRIHDCLMPIRANEKKKSKKKRLELNPKTREVKGKIKIRDETMESKGFSIERMVIQNSM